MHGKNNGGKEREENRLCEGFVKAGLNPKAQLRPEGCSMKQV